MNIFAILNSLFFSKKRLDLKTDDEKQFSAFMINRWMSMYSIEMVNIINNTSNRYAHIFENKREQYDWFYNLFPRLRFKKIPYIKKRKREKSDDTESLDSMIPVIAKNQEISERELRLYHDLFGDRVD